METDSKRVFIGEGRVAKVYLQDGFAYKCYPASYPIDWIAYEVDVQSEIVSKTELPILQYDYTTQSSEIKMPYVQGIELTYRIQKEKYKNGLIDLIALQLQVYKYKELKLPQAHDVFLETLLTSNLDELTKGIGVSALESIERKNTLCHFDLHFSNILFDRHNYIIIDWVNAKLGNPVLDIARTYVILRQYAYRLSDKYMKSITQALNIVSEELKHAVKLMAILRLLEMNENPPHQRLLDLIYS